MKTTQIQEYLNIYKRNKGVDLWIQHCMNQKNLEDTIKCAVYAKNHLGKMNSHQKRLKKECLQNFALNLIEIKDKFHEVHTFKDLLNLIELNKVEGIGELACYDTAYRIGAKLGIEPDEIYLHAGTLKGAEEILGKKLKCKSISRFDLPIPFHDESLSNADLENFLCVYKKLNKNRDVRIIC